MLKYTNSVLSLGIVILSAYGLYLSSKFNETTFTVALIGVIAALRGVTSNRFPNNVDKDVKNDQNN